MTDLPTGTLTMLFTDIEGSTRILDRLGARYVEVVSTQRVLQRAAFARHGGVELGTEGDSVFVVFRSAAQALAATRDAQVALAHADWPGGVDVRVRMGLHTGEPTPHEDGYVGMDVHRAARVAATAHGGQIVLSEATHRLTALGPPEGTSLVDLGRHRLRDVPEPEHLYALAVQGLPQDFPPLRTLGSPAALPAPTTPLVGRGHELDTLARLLAANRLVTLTGPGGTGKTRLALAAAQTATAADGVYFVSLAAVTTEDVLWSSLADALGLAGESKAPPTFLEHLAEREVLFVLDNLEQLPAASGVVAQVLAAAPRVGVLATSRRPLHLSAEQEMAVPPLDVDSDAVALFWQRARQVHPDRTPSADDEQAAAELCRLLDGLPLAVELVAARTRLLGPRALLARMEQGLDVAASGTAPVDQPERQHTLRSTIDWSVRLLPERRRRSFARLGVLAGDFDLEAVEAVLGPHDDALDAVDELVDASLLAVTDGPDGEPRLRMLRTVARHARGLLAGEPGEDEAARTAHAEHHLGIAERAGGDLRGRDHLRARDELERHLDDLRAALAWTLEDPVGPNAGPGDLTRRHLGLRLCAELSWFWYGCGYQAEGRRWQEAALRAASVPGNTDDDATARTLHGLGVLVLQQGDAARSRDLLRAALEHRRRAGDLEAVSSTLNSLGMAHRALEEPDTARILVTEALEIAEQTGNRRRQANALSNLALLNSDAGSPDAAIEVMRRVLEIDTELQDAWGQGADHINLVGMCFRAGRVDEGADHLVEHAADAVALGDTELTVDVLNLLCTGLALRGDPEGAALLLGAGDRMRKQADLPMSAPDREWFDAAVDEVRGRPDAPTWAQRVAEGEGYAVEEALRVGRERLVPGSGPPEQT